LQEGGGVKERFASGQGRKSRTGYHIEEEIQKKAILSLSVRCFKREGRGKVTPQRPKKDRGSGATTSSPSGGSRKEKKEELCHEKKRENWVWKDKNEEFVCAENRMRRGTSSTTTLSEEKDIRLRKQEKGDELDLVASLVRAKRKHGVHFSACPW